MESLTSSALQMAEQKMSSKKIFFSLVRIVEHILRIYSRIHILRFIQQVDNQEETKVKGHTVYKSKAISDKESARNRQKDGWVKSQKDEHIYGETVKIK